MNSHLHNELISLSNKGKTQEEILHFLYSNGTFITDAIVAIRSLYGIKLDEAKRIVGASHYWENTSKDNQNLHDSLEKISGFCENNTEHEFNDINSINVIAPYKHLGMWVFDDARVGLAQEPFVGGADEMIDHIVTNIPNAEKGFVMLFSGIPFPKYDVKLEWQRAEGSGNWYYCEQLDMEGWLCPALFKYFAKTPQEIFVQVRRR